MKKKKFKNLKPNIEISVRIEIYSIEICNSKENNFVFETYNYNENIF